MPKSETTGAMQCCSIFEEKRCSGCLLIGAGVQGSGRNLYEIAKETLCVTSTSARFEDENHNQVKDSEMGCNHSSPLSSHIASEGATKHAHDPIITSPKSGAPDRAQNKFRAESSSGDEDVRDIGHQTVSDAHLIDTQRRESTDVDAELEGRWLRSHFSTPVADATSKHKPSLYSQHGPSALPDLPPAQAGDRERIDLFGEMCDLKIDRSQDSITVASGSQICKGNRAPENFLRRLSILHFNDVYELTQSEKEPVGGASRFAYLFREVFSRARKDCNGQEPFVAFGGDCLNPSILSSATKGAHMIHVLNELKINAAVYGNHEFDFGVDHATRCIAQMKFPWFLSNVTNKSLPSQGDNPPLADGVISKIIEWGEFKIGVIGLIEEEWLDTLATVDRSDIVFEDYVTRGRELARKLKKDGADFVIAMTHMRWPNDVRLAQEVEEIALILGGHDHEYGVKLVNECVIVKSGSDFQTFSRVDLYFKENDKMDVTITRYDVTSDIEEEKEMKEIVERYMTVLETELKRKIGLTKIDLNGRYRDVRSQETNLGNFVADIMRMTTRAEIVLINSGTFRSNMIHTKGKFRIRDLMSILPIHDNVVVIEVTGEQLLAGLENSVSKYPRHEGRFPQISGFCFGFDPKKPPNHRVIRDSVLIRGKPVELDRVYKLATKAYVARGKDGYECFSNCRLLNDPDTGPVLSTVVRNHISNVWNLLRYESQNRSKIRVVEEGRKIISDEGDLHEVYSRFFWGEDPVYRLQKSMEDVVPKDENGNGVLGSDTDLKKNSEIFSEDPNDGAPPEARMPHIQHLIEICSEEIFDESWSTGDDFARSRRKAIERDEENFKLLCERQKSFEDVRWQVCPLLEGRIFHCESDEVSMQNI